MPELLLVLPCVPSCPAVSYNQSPGLARLDLNKKTKEMNT